MEAARVLVNSAPVSKRSHLPHPPHALADAPYVRGGGKAHRNDLVRSEGAE